jgi:hypothetical protein
VHEGNFVNELRLGCNACKVKMRGQLRPGIQRLQHLELLYLDNNELYGPLPPEWGEPGGFPELLELNVNQNQLTGNMPENWAVGPAFLNLADLQMASNRFSGTFPAGFAVTNSSFVSVMSCSFANNQLTGPLPSYINGFITMSVVELHNNRFTGAASCCGQHRASLAACQRSQEEALLAGHAPLALPALQLNQGHHDSSTPLQARCRRTGASRATTGTPPSTPRRPSKPSRCTAIT